MELITFLSQIQDSSFSATLSPRGGYITFSNSGKRGDVKYFQIGLDSFLTTFKDIESNIQEFSQHQTYIEADWRNNGARYFTDPAVNTMSTVQTKPLFSTLSKIIVWANDMSDVNTDNSIPINNTYIRTTIEELELIIKSYTPTSTTIAESNITSNNYSIEELGRILSRSYNSAGEKKQVVSIYMFGIQYGGVIRANNYPAKAIIKISGLSDSYVTELTKALNLYDSICSNLFGVKFSQKTCASSPIRKNTCLQQIFYGAPGTGKSHKVKQITEGESKTVVTFHPDTDYSSFVGAYKPTLHENGKTITYGFVPQAFAKAYINAWKDTNKDYYLVIEEINRGNCAQIFGDIFQLLDRNPDGYSDYVIDVDKDFEDYLKKELSDVVDYSDKIMELAKEAELEGEFSFAKIALPANLHIIATMNTSDQSLFPMDSAFKRRWDWVYRPIDYNKAKEVKIEIDAEQYNWGEFIEIVNSKIKEINNSEDKQLGTFFVKPKDGIIPFEQFRSKVMFYLWFEVYKDEAGTGDCIFKQTEDDSRGFSFGDLFDSNATDIIKNFLKVLKVNPIISPTAADNADTSADIEETE